METSKSWNPPLTEHPNTWCCENPHMTWAARAATVAKIFRNTWTQYLLHLQGFSESPANSDFVRVFLENISNLCWNYLEPAEVKKAKAFPKCVGKSSWQRMFLLGEKNVLTLWMLNNRYLLLLLLMNRHDPLGTLQILRIKSSCDVAERCT